MDIISCRNLLIYLEPDLQKKIFPLFHYALKPGGYLCLGASESVGAFTDLFEPVDKKHKIYSRKAAPTPSFRLPARSADDSSRPSAPVPLSASPGDEVRSGISAEREADRVAVSQFAPPSVLLNAELQVLQFRGATSTYLAPPAGKATFDVLKMARSGLMLPLRTAINKAKTENKTVRTDRVTIEYDHTRVVVNIEVIPLKNLRDRCFLIVFQNVDATLTEAAPQKRTRPASVSRSAESRRNVELQRELAETRDYLQSVQEQHEAANEELQAANEEVQSANEELQSINEELETSKEELESANEELTTVNEEMTTRNAELGRLNSDLVNLQTSTQQAIVLLDRNLAIRRFSVQAEKQFSLLPADIGRRFGTVRHHLAIPDLEPFLGEVIDTVRPAERDVQDRDGRWYSLRVRPYLTLDNRVDGAVLVLIDIHDLKRSERAAKTARDYADAIVQTARDPLLILNADLSVHTANEAFYRTFQLSRSQAAGRLVYELGEHEWNIPELRQLLEEVLPRDTAFDDFEVTSAFGSIGPRTMVLNARKLTDADGRPARILLGIQDVTEAHRAQAAVRASEEALRDSQTRLQLALKASGLGTFVWYVEEDRGEPDSQMQALFGLPSGSRLTLREALATLLHPDDREAYAESVARAIEPTGSGLLRTDIRVVLPDHSVRWLEITAQTVWAEAPRRPLHMSGVASDITDRKRREGNLAFLADISLDLTRLSDPGDIMDSVCARISAYLELSGCSFLEVDEASGQIVVDHEWHRSGTGPLAGVHPYREFVGDAFDRMVHAGMVFAVRDTSAEPNTSATYATADTRAYACAPLLRNGQWRFGLAVHDASPREWRQDELELLRELTSRIWARLERARAEAALQESERRLASELADTTLLQKLSAQLTEEWDSSRLYDTLTGAAATLMHSDFASLQMIDPLRGKDELVLLSSRGFTDEAKHFWQRVRPQSATTCGVALRTGERAIVSDVEAADFMAESDDLDVCRRTGIRAVQTTPLVSRGGATVGMISTHWRQPVVPSQRDLGLLDILARQAADLIERTQAAEALRANEAQLREADQRKDEFLAMLAHELRNPLAPLRTGLELIRRGGDTPGAVERIRGVLERQVGHMVRLVDDLLDVSRITTGKIRLQRELTPLGSLVHQAVEAHAQAIEARKIELIVDLPETTWLVDVDATRFVQVLSNLLHNATKFTDSGGQIKVTARVSDADGTEPPQLTLSVADSGIGVAPDLLPRVFDLFTQGREGHSQPGLGIGLALARRLVEMHGGQLRVYSEGVGRGSEFVLNIPASRAENWQSPRAVPEHVLSGQMRRVLVVDDNEDAANTTGMLVEAMGGAVRVVYDGERGIREAADFKPDVVLLDIGMPRLDGYETCRRIRDKVGSGVYMVAITGYGQAHDKVRAASAGFNAHLTKPVDPTRLAAVINEGTSVTLDDETDAADSTA
jgi:signal transduction histidine kinase/CheY-like chemotaxis protein/PAS domain-containing protein